MKLLPAFNVIPCSGKQPLVSWKEFTERRVTEQEYQEWDVIYTNKERGIICGPISNLFVLDADGEEGLRSLEPYHIPRTPTVKTPHGKHYYFRWTPELDNKVTTKVGILPKVDVRGAGGFVRFYGWEVGPHIAPLMAPPQWLIDLLPDRDAPKVIGETFKKLDYVKSLQELKTLPRHNTLYGLAGGLRARGYEPDEIYELLVSKSREVGLPDEDFRYICNRMLRYPAGQRPPMEEVVIPENFEQFLQDEKEVEYLVPGIFPKGSISFIAGLPETCKTWTAVDLAIELARPNGGKWLDRFPAHPATVLYIDQERPKVETKRRFKALLAAKHLDPKQLKETLTVKCGTSFRLDNSASLESFRKLMLGVTPTIVIVDSYKTFHTQDINSNVGMQVVMESLKAIRNEFGCAFAFVYHESKSAFERKDSQGNKKEISFEYMAGAMVMSEVAESILITVKHSGTESWLHHVKSTYGPKVAPTLVAIEDVVSDRSQIRVTAR